MKKFCFFIAVFILFVLSCDNLYNKVAEEKKDMQRLVFINANGDSVDLTSGNYGITEWSGFANTDLNLQTQQVPFHDGSVYLDGLLSERELSVTLAMNDENNLEKRYQLRRELISILNPKLGEGTLIYTNDYTSKQIKVVPQVPLFENHNSNDSGTPKASLAWTACSPYWEDVEETVVEFGMENPVEINNGGDIPCDVTIDLTTMYVKNIAVRNIDTQQRLRVDGDIEIPSRIITEAGKKSFFSIPIKMQWGSGGEWTDIFETGQNLYVVGQQLLEIDEKEQINIIPEQYAKLCYGNGKYIKWDSGVPYYSEDLKTWTSGTVTDWSGYQLTVVNKIKYINGIFFAVGQVTKQLASVVYGGIYTSTDGVTWTVRYHGDMLQVNDVCYSQTLNNYVAVGFYNSNYTPYVNQAVSTDTETWTETQGQINVYSICWSETYQKYYRIQGTLNNRYLMSSENAVDWNSENVSLGKNTNIISVDSLGVVITAGEQGRNVRISYYDGAKWSTITEEMKSDLMKINAIFYSFVLNGFYIIGTRGLLFSGSSPQTIEDMQTSIRVPLNSVFWKDGKYRACGCNLDIGIYAESVDGRNWTEKSLLFPANEIFYSEMFEKYYIVGNGLSTLVPPETSRQIAFSADCVTWTYYAFEVTIYLSCIAEGNGKILVGGTSGVFSSTDGLNFTNISNEQITNMCFDKKNNIFFGVGARTASADASIKTSVDGVTWTDTGLTGYYVKYIDFIESIIIGSLSSGMYVTKDATNYRRTSSITSVNIAWSENMNLFLSVTNTGSVMFSSDLIHWKTTDVGLKTLWGACYSDIQKRFLITDAHFGGSAQGNESVFISEQLDGENLISRLTQDSDMGFHLEKGLNTIRMSYENGSCVGKIAYRQKYIGV